MLKGNAAGSTLARVSELKNDDDGVKGSRLSIRISPSEGETLREAAEALEMTVSGFVLEASLRAARRVLALSGDGDAS